MAEYISSGPRPGIDPGANIFLHPEPWNVGVQGFRVLRQGFEAGFSVGFRV